MSKPTFTRCLPIVSNMVANLARHKEEYKGFVIASPPRDEKEARQYLEPQTMGMWAALDSVDDGELYPYFEAKSLVDLKAKIDAFRDAEFPAGEYDEAAHVLGALPYNSRYYDHDLDVLLEEVCDEDTVFSAARALWEIVSSNEVPLSSEEEDDLIFCMAIDEDESDESDEARTVRWTKTHKEIVEDKRSGGKYLIVRISTLNEQSLRFAITTARKAALTGKYAGVFVKSEKGIELARWDRYGDRVYGDI